MKFLSRFSLFSSTLLFVVFVFTQSGCASYLFERYRLVNEENFTPPALSKFRLSNGAVVFFKEDKELPTFSVSVYFPRGSLARNSKNAASYGALSYLWRSGGAGLFSPDQLDERLEELSASISANVGDEFSTVTLSGLTSELDQILPLARDVLFTPRFDQERLALWKSHSIDAIKKRSDSAESIAAQSFIQLLYKDSILGTPLREKDITEVTEESVENLYNSIFSLDGVVVAVSGDLEKDEIKEKLEELLKDDVGLALNQIEVPQFTFKNKPGIYFVEKSFPQATIYIGQLGPHRFPDDYPAIEVFNGVFGSSGAFSSMLTKAIRTQKGLSYSVAGGIYRDEPIGRNFIGFQTKSASVGEGLITALNTLQEAKKGDFTELQLQDVKTAARNSFVFRYDAVPEIVRREALKRILHYPSSYDESFLAKIEAVTKSEVVAAANKYWKEDELTILIVGDKNAYRSLKNELSKKSETHRVLQKLPLKKMNFSSELLIK